MKPSQSERLQKIPKDYKALSLDLWGTLLSNDPKSKPAMFKAYKDLLGLHTVPFEAFDAAYRSSDKYSDLVNLTDGHNYGLLERLTFALALLRTNGYKVPSREALQDLAPGLKALQDRLALAHPPKLIRPEIPQDLRALQEAGVRTVVASNTGSYPASLMVELLEGPLALGEVLAAYCFSDQVGHVKPFPGFFNALEEAAQCKPQEVVHVGDNPKADGEGATQAGMHFLKVAKEDHGPEDVHLVLQALLAKRQGLPTLGLLRETSEGEARRQKTSERSSKYLASEAQAVTQVQEEAQEEAQ